MDLGTSPFAPVWWGFLPYGKLPHCQRTDRIAQRAVEAKNITSECVTVRSVVSETFSEDAECLSFIDGIGVNSSGALPGRSAAVVLGSTSLSTVAIDLNLEPSTASDMLTMRMADSFSPRDLIAGDFAVFIYKGELNRGERRVVYAQTRPKRKPRRDSARHVSNLAEYGRAA